MRELKCYLESCIYNNSGVCNCSDVVIDCQGECSNFELPASIDLGLKTTDGKKVSE